MKTVVIGDIHGCIDRFNALLDRVMPSGENDRLILLGDIEDRGPDSWAVWQKITELRALMGQRLVLLRGNHESYWLREKPGLSLKLLHIKVGRMATVRSFKRHGADTDEFVNWMRLNTVKWYREQCFQCVHAGILLDPVEANDEHTLIHDHSMVPANRYRGQLTITGHIGLEKAAWFAGDKKTVTELATGVKHDLPEAGVICIDTGCGKGGKLTAMVIEGKEFTLVEA